MTMMKAVWPALKLFIFGFIIGVIFMRLKHPHTDYLRASSHRQPTKSNASLFTKSVQTCVPTPTFSARHTRSIRTMVRLLVNEVIFPHLPELPRSWNICRITDDLLTFFWSITSFKIDKVEGATCRKVEHKAVSYEPELAWKRCCCR